MGNPAGIIKDTFSIIRENKHIWNTRYGLFGIIIAEIVLYVTLLYDLTKRIDFYHIELWMAIVFIFITYITWIVLSKRLFFRDKWRILLWIIGLLSVSAIFPFYVHSKFIEGSKYDIPYFQIWGTIITLIILWLIARQIRSKLLKGGKLIVAFVVNSDGIEIETRIRHLITNTIANIESEFPDIEIIVPPFGFKPKIRDCERYIKNPFMQADALIYAQVIEGKEDGNLGYVFTKFTSRVNDRRHSNFNTNSDKTLNIFLEQQRISKEWNNLNTANSECISKLKMAENLKAMLLMYCSSLYLLKNEGSTALPIAKHMYSVEGSNKNTPLFDTAKQLLKFSYFSSALSIEHKQHEFDEAYDCLRECVRLFPELNADPIYLKAMARIYFYRNNIVESKKRTRTFKQIEGVSWGYYLNMGFYAMYDNKINEFVSNYKQLLKRSPLASEVQFAIEFLQYQMKDDGGAPSYKMYIEYAIAILTRHYIDASKGANMIAKTHSKYVSSPKYPLLDKLVNYDKKPQICQNKNTLSNLAKKRKFSTMPVKLISSRVRIKSVR